MCYTLCQMLHNHLWKAENAVFRLNTSTVCYESLIKRRSQFNIHRYVQGLFWTL